MNFFIKKDSTLPTLKINIDQEFLDKYGITEDNMNTAAVTFSMFNVDTEDYQIANASGTITNRGINELLIKPKYLVEYAFKLWDTAVVGNFQGEFKLDFLNVNYPMKITVPDNDFINITIFDSITKTSLC
jgi:hypothetical protein